MSSRLIDAIPNDNHSAFLAELLEAYVDRPGLGAMPKADLDALIVHLYRKYSATPDDFDVFDLSQRFRLRETRVKTLVSLGELKFGTMVEGDAWCTVLASTAKSRFAVERLERGQIRFPLENPALYPYLQRRLRQCGASATYSAGTEELKVELEVFLLVLDSVWSASESEFSTNKHLDRVQKDIKRTIERLGVSLGQKRLKALRGEKSVLGEALDKGSKLGSIGKFVLALLL